MDIQADYIRSTWTNHAKATVPTVYRAPSWSWASLDGAVSMQTWEPEWDEEKDDLSPLCDIVRIETTLKDISLQFGEITDGRLILRGKVLKGWLIKSLEEDEDRTIAWNSENVNSAVAAEAKHLEWVKKDEQLEASDPDGWKERYENNPWVKAQFDAGEEWPSMFVSCVQLFENFGIILVEAEKKGTYKRIGSFEVRSSQQVDFDDLTMEEITII